MALPHLVSVDKYLVFHNEAQRAAVHDLNVKTVYDLFKGPHMAPDVRGTVFSLPPLLVPPQRI